MLKKLLHVTHHFENVHTMMNAGSQNRMGHPYTSHTNSNAIFLIHMARLNLA